MRDAAAVLEEIKSRARMGRSLKSGANRGDWLYASAVKYLGSWGKAVEAAGFPYEKVKTRPYTKDEVLVEIRRHADAGERLVASSNTRLSIAAKRHFGSWKAALEAAGYVDAPLLWTRARVIERLHEREQQGLRNNSVTVMREDKNLYAAGRRRFGTWAKALEVAGTSDS